MTRDPVCSLALNVLPRRSSQSSSISLPRAGLGRSYLPRLAPRARGARMGMGEALLESVLVMEESRFEPPFVTGGGLLNKLKMGVDVLRKMTGASNPFQTEYYSLVKYEGELNLHTSSLARQIMVNGMDHPNVASSCNKLARTYHKMANDFQKEGNFEGALDLHKKSLDIKIKVYGGDHPNVAASYSNMAIVCVRQEQYNRAV